MIYQNVWTIISDLLRMLNPTFHHNGMSLVIDKYFVCQISTKELFTQQLCIVRLLSLNIWGKDMVVRDFS